MALSIEKSQDLLSRLESLEKHDRERKDEVNTLQRDFFSQQREIFSLEKKNRFLEDKVATLETESSRWKDLISGLEDKLSKMETKTGLLARKLDSLTTDCNRKIKDTEDQLTQLRLVFNRALVKGQDELKQKITDLLGRTQQIEDTETHKRQSVTSVLVRPTGGKLTTGRYVKMGDVEGVDINGGDFNTTKCCVVPQTGGRMVVNAGFVQKGKGEIWMSVKTDTGISQHIGETTGHEHTSNYTKVLDIPTGQKVWLEAKRVSGDAELNGCRFDSWLL